MLSAAVCAGAEDYSFDTDDFAITGYSGSGGEVAVPAEIDGCPVETIGSSAFYGNETITGLQLPDTLVAIASSNIYFMESLTSISLPDSL